MGSRVTERRQPASERGFTLIELLVVIVILGILAAVVVFSVSGIQDNGREAADAIDERTIRTAQESYFAGGAGQYGTEAQLVSGGFLSEESETHKIYLNEGAGGCAAGSRCEYTIARDDEVAALDVYVGRSSALVADLLNQFTTDTGIALTPNYTGSSQGRANALLAEGASTPADVFFSQDAGTLGQVSRAGLFKPAPAGSGAKVTDSRLVAGDNTWVGVSGRVRVIAYNPTKLGATPVPASVFDLTGPTWTGKVGYDPTNVSFQNFVAAMVLKHGNAVTTQWLSDFKANNPVRIAGNLNVAKAVADPANTTVHLGLINHYYRFQTDPPTAGAIPVANQPDVLNSFPTAGDVGSLVNVAGVGILANTANPGAAEMFVKYLLSEPAQLYFKDRTSEYPVVDGIAARPETLPLDGIQAPDVDLNLLDNPAAVALLTSTTHLP